MLFFLLTANLFVFLPDLGLGSVMWTKMGTQGNEWNFASVYITPETLSPAQSIRTSINVIFISSVLQYPCVFTVKNQ